MSTHTLPEPFGRRLTLAEWDALPEDTEGELVDGVLVEEEVPSAVHELIVIWLAAALRSWLAGTGWVLGSEVKFAVTGGRGRKPDLSVFLKSAQRPPPSGVVTSPPHIMIEVVSATPRDGRRDRVEKLHEYAEFGVRHYWIVDPQLRTVEVKQLGQDGLYVDAMAATGGVLTSIPGCDGLSLDLEALWREVDELAEG